MSQGITWTKIIVFCSAIGLPLLSAMFAAGMWAVRLDDKFTHVIEKQQEQGIALKAAVDKIDQISIRVDTIFQRQDNNKRDMDYKLREMEYHRKK